VPYPNWGIGGLLISHSRPLSPWVDKPLESVTFEYGYLPSLGASPPFDQYQIILLGDRGTCVNNLLKVVTQQCPGAVTFNICICQF